MKFNIDSRELARAISPSVEVATKECLKEFNYEGLITIKADKKKLSFYSYGGTASLLANVSDNNFSSLNYKCKEEGEITVYAVDLLNSLTTMEPGDVEVKLSSGEIIVTLLSDSASKRSMATVSDTVRLPNIGSKFRQSIDIDREIFLKGLNSIMFAPAIEEKMFTYMCVLMETFEGGKDQTVRFSAGTGGRFAIESISGKNIFSTDEDIKIIFPKNNLHNISNVLSKTDSETIKVKTVDPDAKNNVPEQIMIESNGVILCIFGLEHFTKYPDLTGIINHKYSNRIYSDLKGWNYAVGGVEMTKRGHDSNIHNTKVVFESENERFMVTPQTAHACTTPINIVNVEDCIAKGDSIWFKCNSEYLREMIARVGKSDGTVQLNFDSQEILETIPDDKPKQMKPILVKFPEKSNEARDTKENFYMFFTVSTK